MRSIKSVMMLVCFILLPHSARGADAARAVLDRAIQAHGGEARLARTKVGHLKVKAVGAFVQVGRFEETWEETFDLPNRFKRSAAGIVNGTTKSMESVVNGKRGWERRGKNIPIDFPVLEPYPLEYHWHSFLAQLPLLKGKDTQLTALGEERRGRRALAGIQVVSARGTADLFFDKSTGLLAHARRPMPNVIGNEPTMGETLYDDYRTVGGVRFPMRIKISNGDTNFVNLTLVSIEFLDKIDASVFDKPEPPATAESPSAQQLDSEQESEPARWDIRLLLATLGVGVFVGVVWLIVRDSKRRSAPTPPT